MRAKPVLPVVQPDEEATAFGQRADVEVAVMIDVAGHDRNDAVEELENLRSRARKPDDDVGFGRTRENDAIGNAVAVEVGVDRRPHWSGEQTDCRYRTEKTRDDTSDARGACCQWLSRDLTSAIVSSMRAGSVLLDSLSFEIV